MAKSKREVTAEEAARQAVSDAVESVGFAVVVDELRRVLDSWHRDPVVHGDAGFGGAVTQMLDRLGHVLPMAERVDRYAE